MKLVLPNQFHDFHSFMLPGHGTAQVFAGHLLEGGPSITFHDFKYILLEKGGAIQAW